MCGVKQGENPFTRRKKKYHTTGSNRTQTIPNPFASKGTPKTTREVMASKSN